MVDIGRHSDADDDEDVDDAPPPDGDPSPGFVARHRILLSGALLVLVLVAFIGWLGYTALNVKTNLEQARDNGQQAKDALLQGDTDKATAAAKAAADYAVAAQDGTRSLSWSIAATVPWLGSPFEAGRQMTDVVAGIAKDVLQPATAAGAAISPDTILQNGRLDVQTLRQQEPALRAIDESATRLDDDAKSVVEPAFFSVLSDARTQLQAQTAEVARLMNDTALAARLAPSMMGVDGPRTYFIGFQTNAEARGTGGLLGGFGILRFDNGAASVDTLAQNVALDKAFTPIDLGPEYADLYGFANPGTDFRNSNLSSHFPYAAQIWQSMWAQQTGETVDGAIAIDPIALSYILGAVGPVTMPDGEVVSKDNVVELTESTAYIRFPLESDQMARKEYLQGIAREVVKKMTGPIPSPRALLDALGKAIGEGRIAVWSASPDDQKLLEQTPLAHIVPDDAAPYAEVVVNNLGGNKLDYYLQRGIQYTADGCDGATRNSSVSVRLASTAPPDLPEFMAGTVGVVQGAPLRVPNATMITSVRLLGTKGSTLRSATSNGQRVPVFRGVERGHPTYEIQVAIPPGTSGDLVFNLSEPTAPGEASVPVQPLVDRPVPVVNVPACAK